MMCAKSVVLMLRGLRKSIKVRCIIAVSDEFIIFASVDCIAETRSWVMRAGHRTYKGVSEMFFE